ncbi:Gamma-aminobutyric acid type B receptor subunit 2, partial [Phlyctochytrium planicorne]
SFTYSAQDGGFLAGILASTFSTRRVVGIIGSSGLAKPINSWEPNAVTLAYGFLDAVQRFDGECQVKILTNKQDIDGVDVLFSIDTPVDSIPVPKSPVWVISTSPNPKPLPPPLYHLNSVINRHDTLTTYILLNLFTWPTFTSKNTYVGILPTLSKFNITAPSTLSGCISYLPSCPNAKSCEAILSTTYDVLSVINPLEGCPAVVKTNVVEVANKILDDVRAAKVDSVIDISGGVLAANFWKNGTRSAWASLSGFSEPSFGLKTSFTGGYNKETFLYSTTNTTWKLLSPTVPVPASYSAPVISGHTAFYRNFAKELFVVGGSVVSEVDGTTQVNGDVWKFSLNTNTWSVALPDSTSGPGPRVKHAAVGVEDRYIFLWGGLYENLRFNKTDLSNQKGQDDRFNIKNDMWSLDLVTMKWRSIQFAGKPGVDFPNPTISSSVTLFNDTIVLFGGSDGIRDSNALWFFNYRTEIWQSRSSTSSSLSTILLPNAISTPPPITQAVMVQIDNFRLMVFGGIAEGRPCLKSFIYDVELETWTDESSVSLPTPRSTMTAVSIMPDPVNGCDGFGYPKKCVNATVVYTVGGNIAEHDALMMAVFPPDRLNIKIAGQALTSVTRIGISVAVISMFTSLLAILAAVMMRKSAQVRSASPLFLALYGVGSLIASTGIILYNFGGGYGEVGTWRQRNGGMLCSAALWSFSEGCIILYASMVVKNWRVYFLFRRRIGPAKPIKDGVLLMILGAIVLVNTAVLAASQIISPLQTVVTLDDTGDWTSCVVSDAGVWTGVLLSPIVGVLGYGLFISVQTRNLSSKYQESRQINLAIYITSIAIIAMISLSMTIRAPSTVQLLISLIATFTLISVILTNFISKIYAYLVPDSTIQVATGGSSPEKGTTEEAVTECCRFCKQRVNKNAVPADSILSHANNSYNSKAKKGSVVSK